MRILIISAAFPPFKAPEADHMLHLSQQLSDRALDVHVLTTRGNVAKADFSFKIHPVMRNWSWADLPRFVNFVRRCTPDAVLLHYIGWLYNNHPMITFAPTLVKTVLPGVRFVAQISNVSGADLGKCSVVTRAVRKGMKLWAHAKGVDWEYGTLLRDSSRVSLLSDHHRAKLAKIYPAIDQKYVLIPPPPFMYISPDNNGESRWRGREALGVNANDFIVMFFGRIYPTKGIETLLRAFQIVSSKRRNARLAIVGGIVAHKYPDHPFYAQELDALAVELGIDNKVRWTGEYAWDSDDGSTYLRAADVCVLPFDNGVRLNNSSFAAAASHGVPIITTNGTTLERQFVHEENAYLCSPRSPEALARAIETLMDQPALRQRLRSGALKLAQEWFSWERVGEKGSSMSCRVPQKMKLCVSPMNFC